MSSQTLEARQAAAREWFESLQLRICAAFEALEDASTGPFAPEAKEPGRFDLSRWERRNHDGAPGGDFAASAVISGYDGRSPSSPTATTSRNHSRHRPALSWLLPSR